MLPALWGLGYYQVITHEAGDYESGNTSGSNLQSNNRGINSEIIVTILNIIFTLCVCAFVHARECRYINRYYLPCFPIKYRFMKVTELWWNLGFSYCLHDCNLENVFIHSRLFIQQSFLKKFSICDLSYSVKNIIPYSNLKEDYCIVFCMMEIFPCWIKT